MRSHPVRHASLAAAALLAVTAPAQAAVTRTQISAPAGNPAIVVTSAATPANVTVTGTSNGGSASLDLRCDWNHSMLVHSGITPNGSGAFSYRLTSRELSIIVGHTCVLRALPHASVPRNRSAFAGPVIAVSQLSLRAIPAGGSAGPLADFTYTAAQIEGRATYGGVGSCSLRNDSVFASNLFESPTLTTCAARLGQDVGARSSLFVDGASTFFPQNVYSYAPKGIAPITYALSVDPATGAPTLRDIETPLRCTPQPTAFPPNAATCSVFESAPIRVDRTWVQGGNGRISTVTDTYTSTDGKAHHIDVVYQNGFNGTPPAFAFPWLGGTWQVLGTGFTVPRAPKAPASLLVRRSLAQADNDPNAPVGSLTFKNIPDRLYLLNTTTLGLQYARDIPAKGRVTLSFSYSRSTSQAQVAQFAAAAEAALTPPPCIVPRTLGMTLGAARDALHAAHCVIGKVGHETSQKTAKGQIKAQRPNAGSTLPSNGKVSLVVSLGRGK
jgi:hypothetical protein